MKNADELRDENKGVQEASGKNYHAGFSVRLHRLIDQVEGLEIPGSEERGRLSAIAKLTGYSKPSVSEWFKKDKLPSENIFTALVRFFLQYIECNEIPVRVESWLRYGEEATPDPFEKTAKNDNREELKDLALELLSVVVKDDHVSINDTDLDCVLADTIGMLKNFGVNSSDGVPELIFSLIRSYIKNHANN